MGSVAVGTRSVASSTPVTLRSAIPIPSYCNVTPVYGDHLPGASPFIVAQPRFAGITMRLAQGVSSSLTYEPLAINGDVLLSAPSDSVVINGVRGPEAQAVYGVQSRPQPLRFSGLFRTGYYERLRFPLGGCWRLHLRAGDEAASITLWVQYGHYRLIVTPHTTPRR